MKKWHRILVYGCIVTAFVLIYSPMIFPQSLPVVNRGGKTRYQPEYPFESLVVGAAPVCTADGVNCQGEVPQIPVGASADYRFMDGSGAVVADASGNSNVASFVAGHVPTWSSKGLSFVAGQGVNLPASLNTTQTFILAVYLAPWSTGVQPTNQFPALITSSLDTLGANLMSSVVLGIANLQGASSPVIFTSSQQTGCGGFDAGWNVIGFQLGVSGASVDHLFLNGSECFYSTQTATGLLQTSGNYTLGSRGSGIFAVSGIVGTVYRLVTYPSILSPADVATAMNAIRVEVQSRGVVTSTAPVVSPSPVMHFIGDSITAGLGATTWFTQLLSLSGAPTFSVKNWGIGSVTAQAAASQEAARVALQCQSASGPSVAVVFLGTNDYASTGPGTFGVIDPLISEIQTLKSAGCKVYAMTMLSRSTLDSSKDVYDAQILGLARPFLDGVIDAAADPLIGADGASSNATYFQGDGIHPTNAGHVRIANAMNNSLNYYLSTYGPANPRVYTATQTITSSDVATTAACTANCTMTLPDCTGPSGATYVIGNPTAFVVTVAGGSGSQLVNGLASVTLPANTKEVFLDQPKPKSVSGCGWVM